MLAAVRSWHPATAADRQRSSRHAGDQNRDSRAAEKQNSLATNLLTLATRPKGRLRRPPEASASATATKRGRCCACPTSTRPQDPLAKNEGPARPRTRFR